MKHKLILRFLAPKKKRLARRLRDTVADIGCRLEDRRIIREMRGFTEMSAFVLLPDPRLAGEVIDSISMLPGITVVSSRILTVPTAPSLERAPR